MTDYDDANVNEKNMKIFIRILPVERPCKSCVRIDMGRKKVYVRCLQEMQPNRIAVSKKPTYWCFQTDGIFCDSSQEEVYHVTTEDLAPKILDGVSCILMGYGQSGSGKSFTMSGLRNNWEHRGLVTRLLSRMFAEKANRTEVSKIEYRVSFVELYGKEARDLLVSDTDNNKVKINDREPFKDISVVCMDNEKEGLKRIFEGEVRRSIAKESAYPASHLATSVITFHVSNTSLITSWGIVTTAKVHIVEAAGTGTVGRNNCGKPAVDIGVANLMKTELEQFFSYVGRSRSSVVNVIRSSNLLKILGNTLLVSSIIRLISHIRITREDLDITLSTLKFTAKIARLKPVRIKEDIKHQSDLIVHRLREDVNALKKELMLNDMLLHQEAFMNISKARMEQINRSILLFLNGKISDFTLFSVSQAQVLLKNIKDLYNRLSVKEVEVDKLKEMYEGLVKSIAEATSAESLPKEIELSEDEVSKRKRVRSSAEDFKTEEDTKKLEERVGSLDKSTIGVTLGPYADVLSPDKSLEYKHSAMSKQILKINSENIMTVRRLFDSFLKEELKYAKMKEIFDRNERTLAVVRQRFTNMVDKYFQAKRNLDDARDKLSKHQQIRQIMKLESPEEIKTIYEIERTIERDISCYQKVLINLEEEVDQARREIVTLSNQHLEMKSKLESGFRDYSERNAYLLHYTDKSMKALLKSEKKSFDMIRRKFNKFQREILRKTEETEKRKKARLDNKGTCTSTNL
ncbi:kinesin-like protein KIF9 [Bombus bifarius]|uniref:Kinesin-like protein KIF9 n=2 Tax=Pyrobombus TaxID=144703 RepID=A0A6P8N3U3_9HYME|nr:kinesin-like protein KIF9 [Bombus vancouverensis nearcticus]XP_033309607.1 kinesin-like protein KIF9 [Bombus bifarius]